MPIGTKVSLPRLLASGVPTLSHVRLPCWLASRRAKASIGFRYRFLSLVCPARTHLTSGAPQTPRRLGVKGMKTRLLFGAAALAVALLANAAHAEGDTGLQLSAFGGKQ